MSQNPSQTESNSQGLRGTIGVPGVVFMVIAAAAPLTTVAGSLPVMMATGNGSGAPLTYIFAAAILLIFSVGYAAMSRQVTEAGAFYAYVRKGLGSIPGVGAGGLALLAYSTIQAALYGLASATLESLIVHYGGPDIPWWLLAFALMALVGMLGYRSIDLGVKVLGVLLIVEVAVVTVLVVAILVQGGANGFDVHSFTFEAFSSGSPGIALMFAIGSFVGFEATAIYGEESRDPKRTVPMATYIAVIGIGVFFAISSWAIVLAFGSGQVDEIAQKETSDLTFIAADQYVGSALGDVFMILLVTSLFAAVLAFHNAIARYMYALSRTGHAPKALSAVHPRHGSPYVSSLVQTATAVVLVGIFALAGADPVAQLFTWMAGVAIVALLSLMVLASIAIIVYFQNSGEDQRLWQTRIAPILGSIGLVAATALVLSNFTTLIDGSALLASIFIAIIILAFVVGMISGYLVDNRRDDKDVRVNQ